MKIESKNKRKMFHEYILRSGHGVKREMPKSVTERAKEIMAVKPYGGNYGRKMDAQQEAAQPGTSAG